MVELSLSDQFSRKQFYLLLATYMLGPAEVRHFSTALSLSLAEGGDFPVKSVYSLPYTVAESFNVMQFKYRLLQLWDA